ncbi:TVP38/TMEM64 family protein [Clostridium polyendosporum]|uniref:TVP38/TMEM64 family membrane protein n=1 Tax=Clostridium polyendosporum TaxID=69208 RepID=A0A919RY29_9CLOT|nr:TVP38/TMEM64 family protein [Clostridium polyendosporum]GIM28476.1 TVP38/TMEM64 family protein [Clostridium polyendosporum]
MKDKLKKYKYHTIFAVILCFIIFVIYEYYVGYFDTFKDIKRLKVIILSYGSFSGLIFILLQIVQIVFFFIPGEFVQVAGGYIFGPWIGSFLSLVGAVIGSALTFIISKKLGKSFVERLVSEKDLWLLRKIESFKDRKIKEKMKESTKRNEENRMEALKRVVFLLYVIPGIPKDILGYICGISSLSLKDFLIISNTGRIPALFVSTFFGHKLSWGNWELLLIIIIISTVLLILGVVIAKRIIKHRYE